MTSVNAKLDKTHAIQILKDLQSVQRQEAHMSLRQLLSSLSFQNPTVVDEVVFDAFCAETRSAIREAFRGSAIAKAMFDRFVNSAETLTINYIPGAASANQLTLNLDSNFKVWMLGTDGIFHQSSYTRILVHEFSHAIDSTSDPLFGMSPAQSAAAVAKPSFDFSGATVTMENAIMQQLGEAWQRGSYFEIWNQASIGGQTNLTFGAKVDQAIIIDLLGLPERFLSMEGRVTTDDLLIGSGHRDTLLGGAGQDYLWGFGSADRIDGGIGNDVLSGGGGNDRIYGGDGNDTLYGDGGTNTLVGGAGEDTYVFTYGAHFEDTKIVETANVTGEGVDTIVFESNPNVPVDFGNYQDIEVVKYQGDDAANLTIVSGLNHPSGDFSGIAGLNEFKFGDFGGTVHILGGVTPPLGSNVSTVVTFGAGSDEIDVERSFSTFFDHEDSLGRATISVFGFDGLHDKVDLTAFKVDGILSDAPPEQAGTYIRLAHSGFDTAYIVKFDYSAKLGVHFDHLVFQMAFFDCTFLDSNILF